MRRVVVYPLFVAIDGVVPARAATHFAAVFRVVVGVPTNPIPVATADETADVGHQHVCGTSSTVSGPPTSVCWIAGLAKISNGSVPGRCMYTACSGARCLTVAIIGPPRVVGSRPAPAMGIASNLVPRPSASCVAGSHLRRQAAGLPSVRALGHLRP